ncbi:uncharacterized protein LOC134246143 [Saccostrea cucullata]|uniref:uncharacterized protein LOC134246143 n=1 Tax=Saccostrea cuccullata TaxID=36930 RepID=UPI002ED513F1
MAFIGHNDGKLNVSEEGTPSTRREDSYSDDEFTSTPQDSSEDEQKNENNDDEDETFDDNNKEDRSESSNSRSHQSEPRFNKQAQVARLSLTDEEDSSPIRRYAGEIASTPRSGIFSGTLEPVNEAQAPVNQKYYTTSIIPATPRRNMEGVVYNQAWEREAGGEEDGFSIEVHSSSDESGDSIVECVETEESVINLIDTDLGFGIIVTHLETYDFKDNVRCRPWSLERRIAEGGDITLGFQEVTCCDVYEVYSRSGKSVLKFDIEDLEHITFSVKIKYLFRNEDVSYVAKVKQGSKWESVPANLKEENVTFRTTELESLYVICFPTQNRYIIEPMGREIKPKNLGGDTLHFPQNFVDMPKTASIQFSSVDKKGMDKRHKLYPDLFKLKAVSRRVYVEHDISSSKAITAELSLKVLGENINLKDLEVVGFRWKDGDVSLMSREECKAKKVGNNSISLQTDGLVNKSGFSLGLALPGFTQINANEIKLAYRDEYICRFFMHIRKTGARSATVYIDCVKLEDINTILGHYLTVFKIGESDNLYLRDFQRIRVDTTGSSVRRRDENYEKCFVYFFASAEKNCLQFKIEQNQGLGVSPSTTFKFSLDNGPFKRVVHQQDFEPWSIAIGEKTDTGQRRIEQISRGNTMLNIHISKSKSKKT